MESRHIREIHKSFTITPRGAERWLTHMRATVREVDLGPRADEAIPVMMKWMEHFAASVVNTTGAEAEKFHAIEHVVEDGFADDAFSGGL